MWWGFFCFLSVKKGIMDQKISTKIISIEWNPSKFLVTNFKKYENYAVMVLNRPILLDKKLVKHLWNDSTIRILVDGGTNRYVTFCKQNEKYEMKKPDIVCGDFDSITTDSMKFVQDLKSEIINTPDQNDTDFTKALKILSLIAIKKQITSVVVITENSGRLDQIMANINTLFKASNILPHINIFLMSSNSLSWLLVPGSHTIKIPQHILNNNLWCSLIPIGEKCIVTTEGLKWNLSNHCLEFGGIVSTSNTYNGSKQVSIKTEGYLLWSMGIFPTVDE